ncbi:MAG: DNA primase, partial [Nitrosopumilaceae archaeon]
GFSSKIVGEENNIKFLFCACISKDLPRDYRSSVIITSQSSAGKSNLVNSILEPFKDDVYDFTDYTPAFLQRQEVNMDGKIFKMEQMERKNDKKQITMSSLKFLLSEGILKIGLVDRNEKGKNESKTLQVNGIPVFISTSTNYNIDPETLNRTFLMQVDETETQTKKIVSHIFQKYSTLRINDTWTEELSELKKLAKIYKELAHRITDIIIPFGDKLFDRIPTADVTIRRDLQKILNLTAVITFIHASNRMRIKDNDGKNFIKDQFGNTENLYTYALVAELSDFKEAFEIAGTTIKQTLNKLNESSMEIYNSFVKVYNENLDGVKIKQMAKELRLSDNRTRELLNQLLNSGFLSREKTSSREYIYFPTEKKFEEIKTDDIEFTKEELDKLIQIQICKHSGRLEVLDPSDSVVVS